MATLVLGAVGSAVGGPLGGALGALLGQSIDQSLFGTGRRSPRLSDLTVQSSTYGNAVPRLFGRLRVAGTVVWATDIQEHVTDTGAYAYSASFAVALSSRPIRGVERIWADGNLLRGREGDFKARTRFRLHLGDEDQVPDPLIAAVEGLDSTPAYRGLALAVFEDLELASFGNRIPSLTFEVEADDAPLTLGTLLTEGSGGTIESQSLRRLSGYAVHGSDLAGAIAPLVEVFGLSLSEEENVVRHREGRSPRSVRKDDLGCAAGLDSGSRAERQMAASSDCPGRITLIYHDPDRDYLAGLSQAVAGDGRRELRHELPAALPAGDAKTLTENLLSRRWLEREALALQLPLTFIDLTPGDIVQVEGEIGEWRVVQMTIESLVVRVELVRATVAETMGLPADSGRSLQQVDVAAQPTKVEVLFLPPGIPPSADAMSGAIYIVASGGSWPWRPVPLDLQTGGQTWTQLSASRAAVMGNVVSVSEGASGTQIVIRLGADDWLVSCDDEALAAGANMAVVGRGVLQFGQAEALGDGQFRLSRIGPIGAEPVSCEPGDRFVFIDASAMTLVKVPGGTMGTEISVRARGLADGEGEWLTFPLAQ
mgnify:CR=1 FL=1